MVAREKKEGVFLKRYGEIVKRKTGYLSKISNADPLFV